MSGLLSAVVVDAVGPRAPCVPVKGVDGSSGCRIGNEGSLLCAGSCKQSNGQHCDDKVHLISVQLQ